MSKIIQGKFKVLSNKKVGPDYFKMAIFAPKITRGAKPGQFVHLRCNESVEPLLRRPFSFHRLNGNSFAILYEVIGRGTKLLAKKRKGDRVDILGPLGNGFDLLPTTYNLLPILVAGGMGVAPLLALAEALVKGRKQENILVLIGAQNKKKLVGENDFRRLGLKVQLATDDGSRGFKGLVTDLLKEELSAFSFQLSAIYACGPKPMLKEVACIAKKFRISAYASFEENMACGVGACLGCAIGTREGFKRVCKDGPVFNLKEIKW